ncbi:MAG: hypothetical protein K5989_12095 [Lachnospiraceae bacterium]|nr:hypothetical protein [Lachnospiraceae bacterium]
MKTAIYGSGQAAKIAIRWFPFAGELVGVIDPDPEEGKTYFGFPALSLEKAMENQTEKIIIAESEADSIRDIREMLINSGFKGEIQDFGQIKENQDIRLSVLRTLRGQMEYWQIQGDIAELGVYRGDFAKEMNEIFPDRKLYLYDTFTGFDKRDLEREVERTGKDNFKDYSDTSVERVREIMPYPGQVAFMKGHFPESAKMGEKEPYIFALVSLDAELYAPTEAGLRYFWPRLNFGGVILLHNYYCSASPGVKRAADLFFHSKGVFPLPMSDLKGTAMIIKQGGAG